MIDIESVEVSFKRALFRQHIATVIVVGALFEAWRTHSQFLLWMMLIAVLLDLTYIFIIGIYTLLEALAESHRLLDAIRYNTYGNTAAKSPVG